ncbi:serine hydrolase domain-containing protein [Geothrix sp. 21YS21S-4]|uniref:serine hydrolase domain-containing protein n=1 Tax=Geothrix sp. 21YS21S-4 TaxID=3068889 RepID=UPI0027BA0075|nr:serine hydrolase domain-containing protein [Geothrix sp. 21YS21S-4]
MNQLYDLASLAKPLVTAPLALAFLDLDADRRWALGFSDREAPLTVRQLLSHSSGLPPWRPFTGESVAVQLRRGVPDHPLLRTPPGPVVYSDLNYRLLTELLEAETGVPFARLGAASGLSPAPWPAEPASVPDAPDAEAWRLATDRPLPPRAPHEPQDVNARAGMRGHAGFGATRPQLEQALQRWVASGWADRMAVPTATADSGTVWGLGLQAAGSAPGHWGALLAEVPQGRGVVVVEDSTEEEPLPCPDAEPAPGPASGWWFHLGYTGPLLAYRPSDSTCIGLLVHRRGPAGDLLSATALRARRWTILRRWLDA